jgi:hypothetical protein
VTRTVLLSFSEQFSEAYRGLESTIELLMRDQSRQWFVMGINGTIQNTPPKLNP